MGFEVITGETLQALRGMADASAHLVVCDPPYFRVKDEAWDNQWRTPADYLKWVGELCGELKRVMAPNGSLYLFASPEMAARVEVEAGRHFNVLNSIRWMKEAGWHNKADKEAIRSYLSPWEAVIFAEQRGDQYEDAAKALHKDVYAPIGRFVQECREAAGLKRHEVDTACAPSQKPTGLCYRWEAGDCLPTLEQFVDLLRLCGDSRDYEALRRDYEALRRDYEALRRPFNLSADVPYTDLWTFPTVQPYPGKHPCEKPLAMFEHIIRASSREGDLVLDPFAGSFNSGVAALSLNRRYVGIDGSQKWCERGRKKLAAFGAEGGVTVQSIVEFKRAHARPEKAERHLPLFAENVA